MFMDLVYLYHTYFRVDAKTPQETVGASNKKRGKPNVAITGSDEVSDSRPTKRIWTGGL